MQVALRLTDKPMPTSSLCSSLATIANRRYSSFAFLIAETTALRITKKSPFLKRGVRLSFMGCIKKVSSGRRGVYNALLRDYNKDELTKNC
jgi:hypothetical protein